MHFMIFSICRLAFSEIKTLLRWLIFILIRLFVLNQIYSEKQNSNRIRQIESYIKQIASTPKYNHSLFDSAIEYISTMKGQTTVSHAIHQIGVNYKWSERSFLNCLGISPTDPISEYPALLRTQYSFQHILHRNFDTSQVHLLV